ncbi:unnamed protein product [Mytilus edulis]|uniref:Uncharacterized protein n=1 Tax=Mytilus edulis TaxID=6550 RepID=A0A8S3QAF8_MYTED|nr:unnamed protein product [Mytilus edulis]
MYRYVWVLRSVIVKTRRKNNNEHVQVCLGFKCDCKDSEEEQQRTLHRYVLVLKCDCKRLGGRTTTNILQVWKDSEEEQLQFKCDCKDSEEEQQRTCTGMSGLVKCSYKTRKNNRKHVQVCLGFKECDCKDSEEEQQCLECDCKDSEEEQHVRLLKCDCTEEGMGLRFKCDCKVSEEEQRTCTEGDCEDRRKNNKNGVGMSGFFKEWIERLEEEQQRTCTVRDCKDSEEEQQRTCADSGGRTTGNMYRYVWVLRGVIVKTRRKNSKEHVQVCLGFKKCDCKDSEEEQQRTCTAKTRRKNSKDMPQVCSPDFKNCDYKDSEEEQQGTFTGMSGSFKVLITGSFKKSVIVKTRKKNNKEHVQVCLVIKCEKSMIVKITKTQEEEQQRTCTVCLGFDSEEGTAKEHALKSQREERHVYCFKIMIINSGGRTKRTCTGMLLD